MLFFDAHLDLACLAVNGRAMHLPLDQLTPEQQQPFTPPAVTLPSLREGDVRFALATIFTEPDGDGPEAYPAGDAEAARRAGRAQLEAYLTWQDRSLIRIDLPRLFRPDPHTGEVRGGMGVGEPVPFPLEKRLKPALAGDALHSGILIENADPIAASDDVLWWKQRGVCAVGLAWSKPSRYAGGNLTTTGLTPAGRDLVQALDEHRIVHDLSHLSDAAADDLLSLTDRPVIATHSNCRALFSGPGRTNQRHLTDETIREIGRRRGVIGLNLFSRFLADGLDDRGRASIDDCLLHIEHVCDLTGSRETVGLGSDMDGGFGADRLPQGINRPADLPRLTDALARAGWTKEEIEGFAWRNWARFWERWLTRPQNSARAAHARK